MAGREDGARRTEGESTAETTADRSWAWGLLDHLRPTGRDVRRVAAWLADTLGATVSLQDETGALLAGTRIAMDEDLFTDLVTGRIASASWEGEERCLRLVRVERPRPAAACVLAVSRPTPLDRRASEILVHTAQVVEVLLRADETTTTGDRLRRAASDLRLAILQLLMVEDTVSARRVAAGLWPGLLDTDTACVYVLECEAGQRDRLVEECLHLTAEQALVVRCPAVDEHVIVVAPGEDEGRTLTSLAGRHPRTFIGGSSRQSLAQTAGAYGQAVSALAVAHFRPDKAAVYAERTHPERLMDPAALREWTARALRPLDTLAHHTRAELLATTRLGLEFTAVSAAKVLGVSRNTVRARMERVEALLRTDFSDLTVRAVTHLALNHQVGLDGAAGSGTGEQAPRARLADLMAGPAVQTWAHELLARLDADSRDLRRTLRTWIAAGGNSERTAQILGMHPQTVREHVRSAEPVLERQLLSAGTDLYEVVLAHLAVGDLRPPVLDPAKPDHPDAPVHG
ncbi:helix-turn-helix domain-containing protein [Streptomyces sp. YU58]|uniref:helix-turn-helix domain-containing protein n=1 Tax=Streptomyces sp. SX92 TaxID=3158972 RepID=UPI0027B9EE6D|nr:helix-turn-helix domain-containing protein [Streptomyces coralus]WLW57883.1 helix-turn-helix domain-containing protein [Streptomyces coralus]